MSADLLRRAALAIRKDQFIEENLGHIYPSTFDAWNAVADWLDECADIKAAPDVNASIKVALTDRAIKVARAYLGGVQ